MTMKKIINFSLILLVGFACQKKVDTASEQEAIKVVIQNSLDAFKAFDFDRMSALWSHEPYVMRIAGNLVSVGWDSLGVWYNDFFDEVMKELQMHVIKESEAINFKIHLNGNLAFVIYDEKGESIIPLY